MEQRIGIERMEEAVNLFGSFDENIRLLEAEFQVQAVNRGGEIVVSGEPENVMLAEKAVQALLTLSAKGEAINQQHVRYLIGLCRSGQSERISELTQDVICITSKGRPVKPKTIGQKEYVNAILKQTVTIGVGRFGPYVHHDGKYATLGKEDDPLTVSLERAIALICAKREAEAKSHLKAFAEEPGMEVRTGRYGPYIAFEGKNYKIPKAKADEAANLTLDECRAIIEAEKNKSAKPARRRTAAKKA